jgi:glycerol-3-phosphate O-acyltransferase
VPKHKPISIIPFWWLRKIQALWVKSKVTPPSPALDLGLKPGVPVCYVLPSRSVSDILVLYDVCERNGLPLPQTDHTSLNVPGTASFIYLHKMGLLQVERDAHKAPPTPLSKLVRMATLDPNMEVQLVPVCVFWGRNPGREERSILRLLFFDAEHAGILQKIFIVLAQGRDNFVNFGTPISLRRIVSEGAGIEQTAKKLRRVLRVHFRRQRTGVLGPSLPSRESVAASLLQSRAIKSAIEDEARKRKVPAVKVQATARRYIMEISSEQNYAIVRLSDLFFTWLWNRLFNGVVIKHAERLRAIEQTHEIVYLPSHRSHMDYLLLAYSIYYQGLNPPHTAAGINLNFWPVGGFLRRAGAFYIRRTFNGNRLYTVVFNEYVHYLLTKGHSLKFYMEGGRSRTGRLLPGKTGMLAMVLHSYLRNSERPIAIVPIYVGYDKVVEVRTYQTELRGAKKRTESASQLIRARRVLKSNFGKAYIGIAEPIYLTEYLDKRHSGWQHEVVDIDSKPSWMSPIVSDLANDVLTSINSNAIVSPLSILALVLLSTPTKALAEDDLLYLMDKLIAAMRAAPYSRDVSLPEGRARDHLDEAMSVAKIERFQHPGGDVIFVEEREAVLLNYYRNNILHLLAVPALVASFFQYNDHLPEEKVLRSAQQLYPVLKKEFFLRWDGGNCGKTITGIVNAMINENLLSRDDQGYLHRPDVTSRDLTTLLILARTLGHTLERCAIAAALLAKHQKLEASVDTEEYAKQVTLMAQRIAILNGSSEADTYDKKSLFSFLEQLEELGYVEGVAGDSMRIDPRVEELAENSLSILSADIRESIHRIGLA